MTGTKLGADTRGASTVEHIAMIALVALGALGAWSALGDSVTTKTSCTAAAIAAGGGDCAPAGAGNAALGAHRGALTEANGAVTDGTGETAATALAGAAQAEALSAASASAASGGQSGTSVELTTADPSDPGAPAEPISDPRFDPEGDVPPDVDPQPSKSFEGHRYTRAAPDQNPIDAGLSFLGGVASGLGDGAADLAGGIIDLGGQAAENAALIVTHPLETAQVLWNGASGLVGVTWDAVTHPGDTVASLWDTVTHLDRVLAPVVDTAARVVDSIVRAGQDFVDVMLDKPWVEKGRAIGRVGFDAALLAVPVTKVTKVFRIGRALEATRTVELLPAYGSRFVGTIDEAFAALGTSRTSGIFLNVYARPRGGGILVAGLRERGALEMSAETFSRTKLPPSSLARVDLSAVRTSSYNQQVRNAQQAFAALEPGGQIRLGVASADQTAAVKLLLEDAGFRSVVLVYPSLARSHWVVMAVKP